MWDTDTFTCCFLKGYTTKFLPEEAFGTSAIHFHIGAKDVRILQEQVSK